MKSSSSKNFAKDLTMLLPLLMRGILKRQSDEIAKGKITMPQYLVLDLIEARGALKMSEIAAAMSVSLPAMTGIVDRLHLTAMVERCYDPKDRRLIRINLSGKGRKMVHKIRNQREATISDVFGQLSEQERQSYLKIIKKVVNVLYEKNKNNV